MGIPSRCRSNWLQALKRGRKPNIENPPNSEVSERFLQACAHAPAAVKDMQSALQMDEHGAFRKIACDPLLLSLTLPQLVSSHLRGKMPINVDSNILAYLAHPGIRGERHICMAILDGLHGGPDS